MRGKITGEMRADEANENNWSAYDGRYKTQGRTVKQQYESDIKWYSKDSYYDTRCDGCRCAVYRSDRGRIRLMHMRRCSEVLLTESFVLVQPWQDFTPLLLTSIAFAVAAKAGAFNVGVEGEVFLGGITAAYIGINWFLPSEAGSVCGLLRRCYGGSSCLGLYSGGFACLL